MFIEFLLSVIALALLAITTILSFSMYVTYAEKKEIMRVVKQDTDALEKKSKDDKELKRRIRSRANLVHHMALIERNPQDTWSKNTTEKYGILKFNLATGQY